MSLYWLMRRRRDVPDDTEWLCDRERAALAALRFEKRRRDWLLGRWTAKLAVESALRRPEFAPARELLQVRGPRFRPSILAAEDGAPEVWLADRRMDLSLSISHRDGRAICVVAPGPIRPGCDLERIEPRSAAFVEDFFTVAERRWWLARPEFERALSANLIWSAKESALKVLRCGLRADTRSVEVDLESLRLDLPEAAWGALRVLAVSKGPLLGWWRKEANGWVQTALSDPSAPAPTALD